MKVKQAVNEFFFEHKRMYPAINCTLVALIHKTPNATSLKDMRPISCCTTTYKIISKIITTRLGEVIHIVVDDSQSAFI